MRIGKLGELAIGDEGAGEDLVFGSCICLESWATGLGLVGVAICCDVCALVRQI
jgi:hypothetical protein